MVLQEKYFYVSDSNTISFAENRKAMSFDSILLPPQMAASVHHPTQPGGINHLDEAHLQTIHKFLTDMNFGVEEDLDLTQIHLRPVFKPASVLGITLLFYGALVLVGIIVNAVISVVICRRKLYLTDNTHMCVLNLSAAFLIQLIIVIPLTLFVIVVHNWVLGSFICYSLPILQVSFSVSNQVSEANESV